MPAVTALDWTILAFTLLMAGWGYVQGLTAGALSLLGFAGGGALGSRVAPLVLEGGARSPWAPLTALLGAVLVGGALAALLQAFGLGLRRRLGQIFGLLDGVGGAVLTACLGLAFVWIAGAAAAQAPATRMLRQDLQRSHVLQALNAALPPSGPLLGALARIDPFPEIRGPAPGVRPPIARIARDAQVRRAGRSVVRVLGSACGLRVQGSGWLARGGLVVTNAHVVAGQVDTTVQVRGRGPRLAADAVWFDPDNDLAILRVEGVGDVPALELNVGARVGSSAAVLGFPEDGPYSARPGRLGPTRLAVTQDAYGGGPVRRRITALRGDVRPGNSGGPVVDAEGRVVATVFAAAVGGRGESGFGVPDSVVAAALDSAGPPVRTGPCAR